MGLNPEQVFWKKLQKETPLHPELESFYLNPLLRKKYIEPYKNDRPDPEEFIGMPGFSEERVSADLQELNKKWLTGKEDTHTVSQIAEGLLYYLATHGQIGENIDAIPASEYDDRFNHIDLVLELKDGSSSPLIRIGVDVTTTKYKHPETIGVHSGTDIGDKLRSTFDALRQGQLGRLEYFQSEPDFKGGVTLPRVILPFSHEQLIEIAIALQKGDPISPTIKTYIWSRIAEQLNRGLQILKGLQIGKNPLTFRKAKQTYEISLRAITNQYSPVSSVATEDPTPQARGHKS